ncbi:tripartite tricarboxylate transporter substrate binding protein [Hydrogenophaga sp. 2FB]|uniref:Bug family tripartite tricarboxylate transporter substrate binding protein n=1 Tax=Hydrogenophaga sp. 2FB TaxID=2502187 RepID=UPI0010F48FA2|nr:tripartite tricarboxylate transporter substrate binding protein [Hydrogenophaga sp. 2FB]
MALSTPFFAAPAWAQANAWPDKPVRIVVPFAAGGATDLLGRALAVELGKLWKQPVIVDNRPGAGGALGAEIVAKSPADGYTLLLASGSMFTVNPFIYSKLAYSADSFELISKVANGPMVVTVNADVPAKTLKELIAYGKANPHVLNFASAGNGSQVHMAGEAFADASGLQLTHVAYKGEGPAYADLMAGVVQMAVANINAITPLLKGNRVRALAVTGTERSALLPDVPTASEAGLPGFEFVGWFGLMAPVGTSNAITGKTYADLREAVVQPTMKRYMAEQGMSPAISEQGKLVKDIAQESTRWKVLVAKRGIKAN